MNMQSQLTADAHRLLINGTHLPAISGRSFATLNPASGEVLAHVAEAGIEDVDAAVASARAAFEGAWSSMRAAEMIAGMLR